MTLGHLAAFAAGAFTMFILLELDLIVDACGEWFAPTDHRTPAFKWLDELQAQDTAQGEPRG